ncbi:YjbF family lipoprotein [Photobacterium sp. 2_MG-2023]|uniref:YjbF family lipoprotein n=1 Tax=Photobacterium sp. 2_MG-2023 TaxID=3062663 RepID=UPI0026E18467|nr:YjbF family lipoprotein [Photobacterium sp. 2_MG-2023]MDO6579726.1 YjbF family lipoprotein [Photobacterium sp. 2_MG-2023]
MLNARLSVNRRFLVLIALLPLFLSGCSQKFQNVSDTFRLAVRGDDDTVKSAAWIEQLPYASMYARIGDGPQAFMVLALAEPAAVLTSSKTATESEATGQKTTEPVAAEPSMQLKWLAADKGMLVTEHGRLVKTLNLPLGNLVQVTAETPDPVALGLQLPTTPTTWIRRIDWQPGYHFGYQLTSRFEDKGLVTIRINNIIQSARYFVETVNVPSLDLQFDNAFWIEPASGQVLKSRQLIAPGLPEVETQLLKAYGR